MLNNGVEAVADLGQGIFQGALNTSCIVVARKGGSTNDTVMINDLKDVDISLRETMIPNWKTVERKRWKAAVTGDPATSFFTSNLDSVTALSVARTALGTLADLIDDFGIQRGVTPDVIEAHILTSEEAKAERIEGGVLRDTLRGEDIKAFMPATATRRIIYTTSEVDPKKIPHALKHLAKFKARITCKEVKDGKHPWWRLHRPRVPAIFNRAKIIGLTTTRKVELVWDRDSSLVVTDAMYVFAPRAGVPPEFLLGLMQSKPFADFYRLANQGDARVIPQIKATKLLEVPIPRWDKKNPRHNEVVTKVKALLKLACSDAPGASRAFAAQRRDLEQLAAGIYGVAAAEPEVETE
jgi:hypothetical protein